MSDDKPQIPPFAGKLDGFFADSPLPRAGVYHGEPLTMTALDMSALRRAHNQAPCLLERHLFAEIDALRDALNAATSGLQYFTTESSRLFVERNALRAAADAMRAACACLGQELRCPACAAYDRLRRGET